MKKLTDTQTRLVVSVIGVFVVLSFFGFTIANISASRLARETSEKMEMNRIATAEAAEKTAREIAAIAAKSDYETRKRIDEMFSIAAEAVSSDDAVFKLDQNGIIVFMNSVASKEFPFLSVGGRLDEMLPDELRPKHEEAIENAFNRTSSSYSIRALSCNPITKSGPRPAIIKTWTNKDDGALAVINFLEKRALNGHTEQEQDQN